MSYELKTQKNSQNVVKFLEQIDNSSQREDALKLHKMFTELTGEDGSMWGESIIGYGEYEYSNTTGKTYEWMRTGFSPRKTSLSLYIMPGYQFDGMKDLLKKLGKHKLGKACLYIKKLDDIDTDVLKQIIQKGLDIMEERYPKE